jgi:hypothetical protein
MSEHQAVSPFTLRFPAALRSIVDREAKASGRSLNKWIVWKLGSAVWAESPSLYLVPVSSIAQLLDEYLDSPTSPGFVLRMPVELYEVIKSVSAANQRSMSKEIFMRLISCLAGNDDANLGMSHNERIEPSISLRVSASWRRLDAAIQHMSRARIHDLPAALQELESARIEFGVVIDKVIPA